MFPLMGYVFIGLLVVAVGLFLYGGIVKLLMKANLYKDPVEEAVSEVGTKIEGLFEKMDERVGGVKDIATSLNTGITSINKDVQVLSRNFGSCLADHAQELQRLLGVSSVLDQHIQNMRVALDHDTHGLRKISERQQEMKDLYNDKITRIQNDLAGLASDIGRIKGILQNEVFKERQSKAFQEIHDLVNLMGDVSKAVQAGRDLPVGKSVPDTYCRADASKSFLERQLREAVESIKNHRKEIDRELVTATQTTTVLLEQILNRVDRLRDRMQELIMGEWREE